MFVCVAARCLSFDRVLMWPLFSLSAFSFLIPRFFSPASAAAMAAVAAVLRYVWSCAQGGVRMCVRACVRVLV
jgi:hypothetical protein